MYAILSSVVPPGSSVREICLGNTTRPSFGIGARHFKQQLWGKSGAPPHAGILVTILTPSPHSSHGQPSGTLFNLFIPNYTLIFRKTILLYYSRYSLISTFSILFTPNDPPIDLKITNDNKRKVNITKISPQTLPVQFVPQNRLQIL
jgi:hypothetical protein